LKFAEKFNPGGKYLKNIEKYIFLYHSILAFFFYNSGLPVFLGAKCQNEKNKPNNHRMFQMASKYTK
jgi:hypothetical protein